MRFVWKQNACLSRRSGMMDRDQAVYLSHSSLSSSVFSAVMAAQLAFAVIKEYQPLLFFWLLLCLSVFFPCWKILQDWRRYLRMCKNEWTYLLEHKCPNMWPEDHESAIVDLGEIELPTSRIYLSHDNGQLTPEKLNWSSSHFLFLTWVNN